MDQDIDHLSLENMLKKRILNVENTDVNKSFGGESYNYSEDLRSDYNPILSKYLNDIKNKYLNEMK